MSISELSKLEWLGWQTTLEQLITQGWRIECRSHYNNWRLSSSLPSYDKIYIRHPLNNMIGRITIKENCSVYKLDFIIQEHNQRIAKKPFYDEKPLTLADIPRLMEIILRLQSSKKSSRPLNLKSRETAEIILMNRTVGK